MIADSGDSIGVKLSDEMLREVGDFLAERKVLATPMPNWRRSARPPDWEASWPILDSLGIERAELRFRVRAGGHPSVSLIFRGNAIWRMDLAPPSECKSNPPNAHQLGLLSRVCGPHEHNWSDNRAYVALNGYGRLPFRRGIVSPIRRVPQMLADFATRVGIELSWDQRQFDAPPQSELDV